MAEVEQVLPYSCDVKVHSLMCIELTKFIDRIKQIFPDIESARPGCMSGIQALCALNLAIEKSKLLLQHCADCSRLYLAITGETIKLRFERVQKALDQSLSKIQTMVQQPLSGQISDIVNDLRNAKFEVESSEEEACMMLKALVQQDASATDTTEISEFRVFRIVALRLQITSSKARLIEKRAVNKLLDKVHNTDERKKSILKYLLYLIKKYGRSAGSENIENVDEVWKDSLKRIKSIVPNENHAEEKEPRGSTSSGHGEVGVDTSGTETPPEEFICPISSKLMFDPVVIASGKSYERVCIEKWFSEGHDTCPMTKKKLPNLLMTPNSSMKDLIFKWCRTRGITIPNPGSHKIPAAFSSWNTSYSGSISSLSSSLNGLPTLLLDSRTMDYINESDTSNVSISSDASNAVDSSNLKGTGSVKDGHNQSFLWNDKSCQSFADFSHEMYLNFFSKLALLPLESQCKAVEDVKVFLKDNDDAYYSLLSNGFLEALLAFLFDARELLSVNAQRTGLQILLAFLHNSRGEIPSLEETAFQLLGSFIDSNICKEGLSIMEVFSGLECCRPKILASGALPSIIKILDSEKEFQKHAVKILSELSSHSGAKLQILQSGCISKLVQPLGDDELAGDCIKILRDLCEIEESRVAIAGTNECIASIALLLDTGTRDDQEHAATILLSLCSCSPDYCLLVMNEGVIPSLVNISVNGNKMGKESAMKLLHLLRDLRTNDPPDSSLSDVGCDSDLSHDSGKCCKEKQRNASFLKKINIFSKRRSLALF